jgi:putative alpha-1,2-mannosidase
VRGGSSDERHVFYTSLYHALLQPRLFSDADGAYPRFGGGGAVERAVGFDYYDDFSLWDTFRAQHPLLVLLQPQRVPHLVRSLLAKAEQGGFLPNFPGCAGGTRTAGGSSPSTPRRSSPGSPRARPGTTPSSSPTTWPP